MPDQLPRADEPRQLRGLLGRAREIFEEYKKRFQDTVARKRALGEGGRVLDVGCGWGGFPLWAATKYGARVVGITLSPPQAELARRRAR